MSVEGARNILKEMSRYPSNNLLNSSIKQRKWEKLTNPSGGLKAKRHCLVNQNSGIISFLTPVLGDRSLQVLQEVGLEQLQRTERNNVFSNYISRVQILQAKLHATNALVSRDALINYHHKKNSLSGPDSVFASIQPRLWQYPGFLTKCPTWELGWAKVFSKLDVMAGYGAVCLDPQSQLLSMFRRP